MPRSLDVTRDRENHGAPGIHGTQSGKPRGALAHDRGHGSEALRIVDGGRLAEQAEVGGERRLEARLAGLALEGLEQCGFLTADIRPRTDEGVQIEIDAGT